MNREPNKSLVPITLERCVLREFIESDLPHLASLEFDQDVKKYIGLPKMSKEEWLTQAKIDTMRGWAVEAIPSRKFCGRACISRAQSFEKGIAELEIVIAKPYWGRKLGREIAIALLELAFSKLGAKGIVGEVHPSNQASIALLEHFGFNPLRASDKKPMVYYFLNSER